MVWAVAPRCMTGGKKHFANLALRDGRYIKYKQRVYQMTAQHRALLNELTGLEPPRNLMHYLKYFPQEPCQTTIREWPPKRTEYPGLTGTQFSLLPFSFSPC